MLETSLLEFTEYLNIGIKYGLIIGGSTTLIAEGINLALKLFKS